MIFKHAVIIWLRQNETESVLQFFRGLNESGDKRLLAFQLVVSRLENYGAKLFMAPFTNHSLRISKSASNTAFNKYSVSKLETKFFATQVYFIM